MVFFKKPAKTPVLGACITGRSNTMTAKTSKISEAAAVEPALAFVKSRAKFNFLGRFHKLIQKSASHYTLDGDASERLMLKYYERRART